MIFVGRVSHGWPPKPEGVNLSSLGSDSPGMRRIRPPFVHGRKQYEKEDACGKMGAIEKSHEAGESLVVFVSSSFPRPEGPSPFVVGSALTT